ncbi:MAG TPA: hypothetical protein QF626_00610, partial [Prochlorococcaceae cyanobacterium Fu_MAG_50]|nr:hypothetical protein [Prochlorococcaceae cyanobacterium Fu_MAG_50]
LLLLPLQQASAIELRTRQIPNQEQQELPVALDSYLFEDLPFAQRRQALREEIEGSQYSSGNSQ